MGSLMGTRRGDGSAPEQTSPEAAAERLTLQGPDAVLQALDDLQLSNESRDFKAVRTLTEHWRATVSYKPPLPVGKVLAKVGGAVFIGSLIATLVLNQIQRPANVGMITDLDDIGFRLSAASATQVADEHAVESIEAIDPSLSSVSFPPTVTALPAQVPASSMTVTPASRGGRTGSVTLRLDKVSFPAGTFIRLQSHGDLNYQFNFKSSVRALPLTLFGPVYLSDPINRVVDFLPGTEMMLHFGAEPELKVRFTPGDTVRFVPGRIDSVALYQIVGNSPPYDSSSGVLRGRYWYTDLPSDSTRLESRDLIRLDRLGGASTISDLRLHPGGFSMVFNGDVSQLMSIKKGVAKNVIPSQLQMLRGNRSLKNVLGATIYLTLLILAGVAWWRFTR
jgi:hypothetical protein